MPIIILLGQLRTMNVSGRTLNSFRVISKKYAWNPSYGVWKLTCYTESDGI